MNRNVLNMTAIHYFIFALLIFLFRIFQSIILIYGGQVGSFVKFYPQTDLVFKMLHPYLWFIYIESFLRMGLNKLITKMNFLENCKFSTFKLQYDNTEKKNSFHNHFAGGIFYEVDISLIILSTYYCYNL